MKTTSEVSKSSLGILLLLLTFFAANAFGTVNSASNTTAGQSQNEKKDPFEGKHWYLGLGPMISNALVGANGTKYGVTLAYEQGLSEYWDLLYFYMGNFNTGSQGSTPVTSVGVAAKYYFNSRISDTAPYLRADVSYGGGNRSNDASAIFGGAIGIDFFRTQEATFDVELREFAQGTTSSSSVVNWPSGTELMFGLIF